MNANTIICKCVVGICKPIQPGLPHFSRYAGGSTLPTLLSTVEPSMGTEPWILLRVTVSTLTEVEVEWREKDREMDGWLGVEETNSTQIGLFGMPIFPAKAIFVMQICQRI